MTSPVHLGPVALLAAAARLWAGNAIVGRVIYGLVSPVALSSVRWPSAGQRGRKDGGLAQPLGEQPQRPGGCDSGYKSFRRGSIRPAASSTG